MGPRVLIVDDDAALLEALPETLRLRIPGIEIDTAESGPAALRRLTVADHDAIVCDIKMPGMDGLALLREIRRLRPQTPTLMITGHGEHDLALLALRGGAYDFIQKPIDREYFTASLRRAIEVHRLNRQVLDQQRALERHARHLQDKIDERTSELREANEAKDRFIAILAHELRNPLAPIQHAIEILQRRGDLPPEGNNACEVMRRQVVHVSRLLDDLLDVSRIQHGKIRLERSPIELGPVIDHALEACMPMIRSCGHEVTLKVEARDVCIDGDAARLEQVVSNLLHNAAKYTEPGGKIVLSTRQEGGTVVIEVSDSGIGIAPEMLDRIFDLFAQTEQSLDRPQGGLGIGLTLVRHLVRMHGGEVRVRSPGIGRGSSFLVRLPVLASSARKETNPCEPRAGAARRILIVEDNADSRIMLGELLKLWGHWPDLAADGLEGVEAARRARPDVALVDIGLPGLDGYEVARRIRALPGRHPVYLIALTGYGQPDDRRRSREAGFDAHLVKPVNMDDLLRALQHEAAESA